MKPIKAFIFPLFVIFLAGCAAPQLQGKYQIGDFDILDRSLVEGKVVAVNVGEILLPKSLVDPYIVGEAKVGVVNLSKPIRSEIPIDKILIKELNRAFSQAGFSTDEKDKCQYFVTGRIDRFWVDEYATGLSLEYARASIRYDVVIRNKDNRIVWGKSLEKFNVSDKSMDATDDDIPTLLKTLKNSIEDIFKDESFWKTIK